MTLTPEQREDRRKHIGASDVPALFGKSPYKTAWDVWASKVHGIDSEVGDAAALGDALEPWLVERFEERVGLVCERHVMVVHAGGVLAVNLDGCIRDGESVVRIVECKTHGLASMARRSDEWGEPGTDQVPHDVMLQVQTQLEVCDCPEASVEVLMGGRGHMTYTVKRSRRLGSAIVKKAEWFWNKYVATGVPPEDSAPTNAALAKRLPVYEGLALPIPDEMAGRYFALKHMKSLVDKAVESSQAEVLAFLNGAERGMTTWGDIELRKVDVKGYEVPSRTDIRVHSPRKANAEAFEALIGTTKLPALVAGVEVQDDDGTGED